MPWFYYGVHTENGKKYFGSPKTHKWIWKFYDFEIEILQYFQTREEANLIETRIINYFLNDKNCLNECSGGKFSYESLRRGALIRNSLPVKESTKAKISIASLNTWNSLDWDKKEFILSTLKKNQPDAVLASKTEKSNLKRKTTMKNNFHSKGEKNSQYGTIWITDGLINLKIKNYEPIPNGFYRGRIIKK